jgi:hypothetical protein
LFVCKTIILYVSILHIIFNGRHPPPVTTNEALTKKKYCQSVRIYHQIFNSDNKFDTFVRSLGRMKKSIFEVMFQMFLEVLPAATVSRLPGELWEKIWKHTQNEYFTASTVPLLNDIYFKAGLRAGSKPTSLHSIEQVPLHITFPCYFLYLHKYRDMASVAEPEPQGAGTFGRSWSRNI